MRRGWLMMLALAAACSVASACDCCAKNATSSECKEGSELRARPDCACCMVCGGSAGETCNDKDRPCNPALDCGSKGVCTDEKCRSDDDCDDSRFCLGGVCSDPCSVLDHCRGLLKGGACKVRSHRPVCTCPAGSTLDSQNKECVKGSCKLDDGSTVDVGAKIAREGCQQTCICEPSGNLNCTDTACAPGLYRKGAFADDSSCVELRSSADVTGCCVNVVCTDTIKAASQTSSAKVTSNNARESTPAAKTPATTAAPTTAAPVPTTSAPDRPSLDMLPLAITHNSTRLQLPAPGGKLTYRAEGQAPVVVELSADLTEKTVTSLLPGTGYLFTWKGSDGERSLRVDTRPGCVTNASSHAIGETYHMGCQSTCVCGGPNQPSCRPRCSFTRGTVTDKSCSERPDFDDPECCVQLVCAVTSSGGQIVPEATTRATTTTPETTTVTTTAAPTPASTTTEETTTAVPTTAAATESPTEAAYVDTTTPEPVIQQLDSAESSTPAGTPSTTSAPTPAETQTTEAPASTEIHLLDADAQPQPTLIATSRSHNSVTLVWDDFKPAEYTRGYVAQWRKAGGEQWRTRQVAPIQAQSVPQVVIDGLMPATSYEARIAIYDTGETTGDTTETIPFTTAAGCVDGNETYGVGETFNHGCDESCVCEAGGEPSCQPRCLLPFYRAGHFKDMPLCKETPHDDCCVVAVCDTPMEDEEGGQGAEGMDPCEFVHCGPNARCEMAKSQAAGKELGAMDATCVCLEGYSKDTNGDCLSDVADPPVELSSTACQHEGKTYKPGEEFFKGCQEKCICTDQSNVECKPRCKVDQSTILDLPDNCERVPEPAPNQDCCLMVECRNNTEGAAVAAPDPDFAGCMYGEEKYQPDEVFYQGCKSRCTCNGFGDVSCQPRCPPQQPSDDPSCSVRPDPADPCCNISICEPQLSAATAEDQDTANATKDAVENPETSEGLSTRFGSGRSNSAVPAIKILDLTPIDASSSQVEIQIPPAVAERFYTKDANAPLKVEWKDGLAEATEFWMSTTMPHEGILLRNGRLVSLVRGLAAPDTKIVRVTYSGETSAEVRGAALAQVAPAAEKEAMTAGTGGGPVNASEETDAVEKITDIAAQPPEDSDSCTFNNITYNLGEEFHDGCRQFCICTESGVNCAAIECPHHFGLKRINPDCLKWSDPVDFVPSPPDCCPDVTCEDDGSCVFEGETFKNFQQLPEKITGCEETCFCEFGNVTCRSACPPVPATPPRDLPCEVTQVTLGSLPNGCCKVWQCAADNVPGAPNPAGEPDAASPDMTLSDSEPIPQTESSEPETITEPTPEDATDSIVVGTSNLDSGSSPDLGPASETTDRPMLSTTNADDLFIEKPSDFDTDHSSGPTPVMTEDLPASSITSPSEKEESETRAEPTESLSVGLPAAPESEELSVESDSSPTLDHMTDTKEDTMPLQTDKSTSEIDPSSKEKVLLENDAQPEQEVVTPEEQLETGEEPALEDGTMMTDGQQFLVPNGEKKTVPSTPQESPFQRPWPVPEDVQQVHEGMGGVRPPSTRPETAIDGASVPSPVQTENIDDQPSVVVIDGQRFLENNGQLIPLPGHSPSSSRPQGPPAFPFRPTSGHSGPPRRPQPSSIPGLPGVPDGAEVVLIDGQRYLESNGRLFPLPPGSNYVGQQQRPQIPSGLRPRPSAGRRPVLIAPNGQRIPLGQGRRGGGSSKSGRHPGLSRRPQFVPRPRPKPDSPDIIALPDGRKVQVFPDGSSRLLSTPTNQQEQHIIAIGPDGRPLLGPDGRPIPVPASVLRQQQQLRKQQQVQQLQPSRPNSRPVQNVGSLGTFAAGDRIPIDGRGRPIPLSADGIPVRTPVFDLVIGADGKPITDEDGRTMLFPVAGSTGGGSARPGDEPDDATLLLQHLATTTTTPSPALDPDGFDAPQTSDLSLSGTSTDDERSRDAQTVTSRPSVPPNIHNGDLAVGKDIDDLSVTEVDAESVRLAFSIPPALVGLPGKTEVLYTDRPGMTEEDTSWDRRVYQTTSGLLDSADISWELGDLLPNTVYVMQVKVVFDSTSTILQSNVVEFKTHEPKKPALPPKVPLDAELQASDVGTTSALIRWRRLTEQELEYIDGIQLRYRDVDVDAQVWTMTPFIHRELTTYLLTELKSDTTYQVDIVLMPFQSQRTEMVSTKPLQITTLPVYDRYDFNVSLSKVEPTGSSVRVAWTGIPQPQYQYVNVYRLVYIDEKEREEMHSFKLAKTADEADITIKGLKPSSKYQVWLEAYLKNGKKRVSEVQEFDTKPGPIGKAEEIRGLEAESSGSKELPPNNYYSGMVAAAIIATMAIILCLFLAFLLVKKASQAAAQPTPPARKNGPSYENPAFKPSEPVDDTASHQVGSV